MDYATAAMNGSLMVAATAPVSRAGQDALHGLPHAATTMSDADATATATPDGPAPCLPTSRKPAESSLFFTHPTQRLKDS